MNRDPEFSMGPVDLRNRFVDIIITIVMLMLAVDGWLAYVGP
jgi:hypothetical protein